MAGSLHSNIPIAFYILSSVASRCNWSYCFSSSLNFEIDQYNRVGTVGINLLKPSEVRSNMCSAAIRR